MITKALFDQFLKNECTAEERRLVNDYLQEHPEILDEWMPEEEAGEREERLHPVVSARMLKQIKRKTGDTPVRKLWRWGAVAAAVIVIILLITLRPDSSGPVIADLKESEGQPPPSWQQRFNTTQAVLALGLPDASTVELQPGSGIKYEVPFNRKIYITGEGLFKVAKDLQRPFMVYGGGITTTVLGTSFTVSAFDSSSVIRVRLFTGKVAVSATSQSFTLKPGQEFVYNKQQRTSAVSMSGSRKAADARPDWYQFSGQSLSQVFDQLSEYYHVEIDYKPADLQNLYFAGKFDKQDSLSKIMTDIALLNNLTIQNKNGKYIVRNQH